jgi:L-2-hydroxyglutarate oxidase
MPEIVIIGAGIVGVSTAYQLNKLQPNWKIKIIEKEPQVASHQTGHNSGVIHSGIYYKPGSLKAQNCIRGYDFLIEFCRKKNIPFEICGKVIVALNETQLDALDKLYHRGIANGLKGLEYLNSSQIKEIEPHCTGIKGIKVPQTGIVAYKRVTEEMKKELEASNTVEFFFNEMVLSFNHNYTQTTKQKIKSDLVINCAGLFCDKIATLAGEKLDVRIIPFRGEYYTISPKKAHMVQNLIYPVPDANFPFLGVHFTRRITGEIEAGPNAVFAFKREGYKKTDFNLAETLQSLLWRGFQKVAFKYWKTGIGEFYRSFSKSAFTRALQELVPEIQKEDLEVAPAGVRAQACDKNGNLIDDFYIQESERFIHVLNAPSPAATSSLSIGLTISEKVIERFHQ